ncbi:hypothetical protein MP478_00970 [Chryseobacterium sp. WG14]|uniref:hypothetical protein n=1 Tax=unclassified Chryseobacterium TaxID=2593645 RepID=UPI00211F3EF2|nr:MULTISPECIES: hypothetical protein [unclassified Chryseobacterium]MCQ9635667.1 hypothetical protein [Chryseobacterium sp. WG23]MCQ9637942.1 hypothetical protein [Chryseobacterium sp. WG14]
MKHLLVLLALPIGAFYYSQVGINTPSPTQTLDVNGTARIRQLPLAPSLGTAKVIISQTNGDVYQIDPAVFTASLKIPTTVLSVKLNTPGSTLLPGGNVTNTVVFDTIDINPAASIGTWSSSTNTFTVNKEGVYQISASIQLSDFSNPSANFSIRTSSYNQSSGGLVLANNKYAVNQVLALKLNPGDIVNCTIVAGGNDTFYEEKAIMSIIYTPL